MSVRAGLIKSNPSFNYFFIWAFPSVGLFASIFYSYLTKGFALQSLTQVILKLNYYSFCVQQTCKPFLHKYKYLPKLFYRFHLFSPLFFYKTYSGENPIIFFLKIENFLNHYYLAGGGKIGCSINLPKTQPTSPLNRILYQ